MKFKLFSKSTQIMLLVYVLMILIVFIINFFDLIWEKRYSFAVIILFLMFLMLIPAFLLRKYLFSLIQINKKGVYASYLGKIWFEAEWDKIIYIGTYIYRDNGSKKLFFSKIEEQSDFIDFYRKTNSINSKAIHLFYTKKLQNAIASFKSNDVVIKHGYDLRKYIR